MAAATTEVAIDKTDVDVSFILYNAKGIRDVLGGAKVEGSSYTWQNFIEASLQLVWNEKYPEGAVNDEPLEGLSLNTISDTGLRGGDNVQQNLDVDRYGEELYHDGSSLNTHLQGHTSTLALKLEEVHLTAGVDIDCPSNVPTGTVSGKINICQSFTATLTVSGSQDERRSVVRADVIATFDEAMRDGTMTKEYNGIDGHRVFRVPGHSHCELYYDKSDCQLLYTQRNTKGDGVNNTTGNINMGTAAGILLLFSFFGVALLVHRRRAVHNEARSEVPEEEKDTIRKKITEGSGGGSFYELTPM